MDAVNERGKVKAAPNVTPLVDVVLVLLILFIILLPAVDDAVRLPLAKHASSQEEPDSEPILLVLAGTVAGPGGLKLELGRGDTRFLRLDGDTSRRGVVELLRIQLAARRSARVFLKADGRLAFHHIQTAFDLCREAGAELVLAVTAADHSQPNAGGLP